MPIKLTLPTHSHAKPYARVRAFADVPRCGAPLAAFLTAALGGPGAVQIAQAAT